jgi:hypothetical protein
MMNKQTDVLYPRATHYASNKENTFPFLFFGVYLIFLFFSIIVEKRIKEYYVTMEERVLQTYKFKAQGQD